MQQPKQPEKTSLPHEQTDLFTTQPTKRLSSSESKVHSLELGNLTGYVCIKIMQLCARHKGFWF